jgi:hypothetical protein
MGNLEDRKIMGKIIPIDELKRFKKNMIRQRGRSFQHYVKIPC